MECLPTQCRNVCPLPKGEVQVGNLHHNITAFGRSQPGRRCHMKTAGSEICLLQLFQPLLLIQLQQRIDQRIHMPRHDLIQIEILFAAALAT